MATSSSYEQITEKGDGLQEKLVSVKRVTKVRKGGRLASFAATVVVGDRMGRVGYARSKAKEVPVAIQKAMNKARRNMFLIELDKGTLYSSVEAKFGASKVRMMPASEGTGIIAGGAMRALLEVAGVKNVLTKCFGSTNSWNVLRATTKAFKKMLYPKLVANKRGKPIEEILQD